MTTSPIARTSVSTTQRSRNRRPPDQLIVLLALIPSIIAIALFVYGFIATTLYVSASNWGTLKIDLSIREPLFATWRDMLEMPRFQADLRNTLIFTTLFLAAAVGGGLLLAILLDQHVFGSTVFRNVFLFPYALSFIVTGVAWRWIFNPETGVNILFDVIGLNPLLLQIGLAPLKPGWMTDPTVALRLNDALIAIFPAAKGIQVQLGVPVALIPVMIAATWQLSGFAMASYLAGLGAIPPEIREAARMDGATEKSIYRRIIIPMLAPITVSNLIILGHVSLKIFDLIFSMSGVGPGFATDVPGIFVFEQTFKATRYNLGAAASIAMLILVSIVIVPYLIRSLRNE